MLWQKDRVYPAEPVLLAAKQVESLSRELWLVRREIHDYISRLRCFLEQPPLQTNEALESFFAGAAAGSVRLAPSVTLAVAQLEALSGSLSNMRHDINGQSSVVLAALELLKLRPADRARHLGRLTDVPMKMQAIMDDFCGKFVGALAPGYPLASGEDSAAGQRNVGPPAGHSPFQNADAVAHLSKSPNAIKELMTKFSAEFDKALGITLSPAASPLTMPKSGNS